MERKLIDITLPRMEDKPKSLNTQRDKGTLVKLGDSWITQELSISHSHKDRWDKTRLFSE